jgi:two-component system response regulator AtoC
LCVPNSEFDLPPDSLVFGHTSAMAAVRKKLEKVTGTNIPVLIHGESGTGKEVVAKLLHSRSPWGDGPFVKVNCPAIPSTLLESELFGYEKGAFTGAYGMKPGRVELAHRGTLFMDEIAELEPGLQAKLLQLLQDGQFSRIGAQEDKRVEVRVVCATNRDLEAETENGSFRQDLYYRINVLNIHLPRLRDRRNDIPDLVGYFWQTYNDQFGCQTPPLSNATMQQLLRYDWPGNIRQLQNLMKRYVILGSEESVTSALVVRSPNALNPEIPVDGPIALKKLTNQAVRELEGRIILKVLQAHSWNRKQAARALSISYRALLYKIRQAGLPSKRAPSRIGGFSFDAPATN